jgi:hypothetical protein
MELHRRYYSDDDYFERPPRMLPPYLEIQKRIGSFLRELYVPPKDLPHRLFTLLIEVDKQKAESR